MVNTYCGKAVFDMKRIFSLIVSLVFATVMIAVIPTEADADVYSDTLRLHILAASDDEEDQSLKLCVRDAILSEYSAELSLADGMDDAVGRVTRLLPEIKSSAEKCIREYGFDYSVDVSLGEEWYDTREYDGFALPKGKYTSLIIRIGEAGGKNWWCVMYPPMCLDMATDAPSDDWVSDYSDAELSLISGGKYRVKFKLVELISGLLD